MLIDMRCPPDKDVWSIVWQSTEAGLTSIQPCPGAADVGMFSHVSHCFSATLMTAAGNATRTCHDNQIWDDTDVSRCQSQFITDVVQEVTLPLGWSS